MAPCCLSDPWGMENLNAPVKCLVELGGFMAAGSLSESLRALGACKSFRLQLQRARRAPGGCAARSTSACSVSSG